jgi:hypothetical protein
MNTAKPRPSGDEVFDLFSEQKSYPRTSHLDRGSRVNRRNGLPPGGRNTGVTLRKKPRGRRSGNTSRPNRRFQQIIAATRAQTEEMGGRDR